MIVALVFFKNQSNNHSFKSLLGSCRRPKEMKYHILCLSDKLL